MEIKAARLTEGKEFLSCRNVLWYLVFSGFAIHAMLESTVTLTIVAMVVPRPTTAVVEQCKHDVQISHNLSSLMDDAESVTNFRNHNLTQISVSTSKLTTKDENSPVVSPMQYTDRFFWNEYEQGLVLGSVFWIHWTTQTPGGLWARRYGTKLVFGWSNLATALLGFLIPLCARYHLYALVTVRAAQGLCTGVAWPSMHNMAAKWIPLDDRAKFVSSYAGSFVGAAITAPLGAILIDSFGWASVFYVISFLGVIWCVAWYYLAYDSPQEHPRISEAEKTHILHHLRDSVDHSNTRPVPWKAILTSGPFWMTTLAACGTNWSTFIIGIDAASYFTYIHGWSIGATSLILSSSYVARMIFSYVFSSVTDWVLRTKRMSTSNLRKFAVFVSNGIQSLVILALALNGCHPNLAVFLLILQTTISGSNTAGTLASCIDLSPNYASILLGIVNTVSVMFAGVCPLLVGMLTNNNQTIGQWRLVFLITAAITCLTGIPYIFFGISEVQSWNDNGIERKYKDELEKLQPTENDVKHDKPTADVITECRNDTPHAQ